MAPSNRPLRLIGRPRYCWRNRLSSEPVPVRFVNETEKAAREPVMTNAIRVPATAV